MGSSESKMTASAPVKPELPIKKHLVSHLIDPRSPSTEISRTPIQFGVTKDVPVVKSECPLPFTDPRSPTIGISRTPVREAMRATVGSFARRLGMLFLNEMEGKAPEAPQKRLSDAVEEEVSKGEELASTEPLLTPQPVRTFGSMAEHANLLATPVMPPLGVGNSSPFVLLDEPQVEVELVTETDLSLEEAEEAKESPLNKRLSMSLITCHEGATSAQIFAEVHCDSASSPLASVDVPPHGDGVEHSYALPSITVETATPVEPSPPSIPDDAPAVASQPEEAATSQDMQSTEESEEVADAASPPSAPSEPAKVTSPEPPQLCTGIRCPTFDPKSPSQVVFKPQWLGKSFGATGLRARGVQGYAGKGGSSPLAVRVAVKNATNENKGHSGKRKSKGTEGRSPLQILKETNSPRDQRAQVKQKVSTPDRQRLGQMDSRVLAVSLDKENR